MLNKLNSLSSNTELRAKLERLVARATPQTPMHKELFLDKLQALIDQTATKRCIEELEGILTDGRTYGHRNGDAEITVREHIATLKAQLDKDKP